MEGTQVTGKNSMRVAVHVLNVHSAQCTRYSRYRAVCHFASWEGCNDFRTAQQETYGK